MLDLTPWPCTASLAALDRLRTLHEQWTARGRTLLDELSDEFTPWVHYPDAACEGAVRFFYHRHAESEVPPPTDEEHGHFHIFMSPAGMPPGTSPLVLPERAVAWPEAGREAGADGRDRGMAATHAVQSDLCHLLAVGIDGHGAPRRLFTTNRWVTGETWYAAPDVLAMLDHARLAGETLLEQWLSAVFQAFRSDIQMLLHERDAAVAAWRLRRRGGPSHEDRRLVTPSSRPISLWSARQPASRDRRAFAALHHLRP